MNIYILTLDKRICDKNIDAFNKNDKIRIINKSLSNFNWKTKYHKYS